MSRKKLFLVMGLGLLLFGCQRAGVTSDNRKLQEMRLLMGTTVSITVRGENKAPAGKAIEQAFRAIEKVDDLMSTYKKDSEISRLNREGSQRPIKVSRETFRVIRESLRLSKLSDGAFDITVKPLVDLWRSVRKDKRLPGKEELKKTLALVNYRNILLNKENGTVKFRKSGMEIALGGIAKGYAVDKAIAALRDRGIKRAIVDAGGDLYALGRPPDRNFWEIGIQSPRKKGGLLGVIKARDEAVVTSGQYERFFTLGGKRYGHILNPRTGEPLEGMLSVTVLAKNTMTADGLRSEEHTSELQSH